MEISCAQIRLIEQQGGANTIVSLCLGAITPITNTISFTAPGQEISTRGYPTDSTRTAITIQPGSNVTIAIHGNWQDNAHILNIQVDGNRPNAGYRAGYAPIQMGGGTTGQTVSHVVVRNTRGWSCTQFIGSGQDNNPCRNANITFNTIGPRGSDIEDKCRRDGAVG
jgi:hypothetical protein